MDGIVNESNKRRLPQWMLGGSAADQVKKSRKGDVLNVDKIEKEGIVGECKVKKSRGASSAQCDNEVAAPCDDFLDDGESNVVVKRQRVTRKRKDVVRISSDAEEAVIEKKSKRNVGRKAVQKSASSRREKRKSKGFESTEDVDVESKDLEGCDDIDDIEAASLNEDDADLTMDDLMSIANEFVEDEKDRGQQKNSDAEQILHKQSSTNISINKRADSVVTSETGKILPAREERASCHNIISTGDPAQDMLDLLLGPLLTQPPKKDIITDEMIAAHRLKKQNQKLDSKNAVIPLAKKKASLKDQVAMFLS